MQTHFLEDEDLSQERPIIGLSGGINSAGLLCYLASEYQDDRKPSTLLLYYAHLREHSPDTFAFVADCVRYARERFDNVQFGMHRTSAVEWMREQEFIPHPAVSPCTGALKIVPMEKWAEEHGATTDLVGYVRSERRRIKRQQDKDVEGKKYPIAHLSDADCFALVDREIGWHPEIYDIRNERGERVFTHNNCLPCKNMNAKQFKAVEKHYPEHAEHAREMAEDIGKYWGRKSDYAGDPCSRCAFD